MLKPTNNISNQLETISGMSCRQMTNILKQTLRGLINNARMIIFAGTIPLRHYLYTLVFTVVLQGTLQKTYHDACPKA